MSLADDKALHRAARLMKRAGLTEAQAVSTEILKKFSQNTKALVGYRKLKSAGGLKGKEESVSPLH